MYPLPAHTVDLVLQYVSPLADPLPPHLVSVPLRQRHHFLQLSPSSPVDYLCWPSPDSAKVIDLLDRLPPLSDRASYPTRYTSDIESSFAHVQISSNAEGLRMLFHWDDVHGWRYHDLRLMPFPSFSFSTPRESLASISACGASPPQLPSVDLVAEADHVSSEGDDTYWGAYEATGHDPTSPLPPRSEPEPDALGEEDAYWAQYASVQGSADSTVPSPLPINRKLRPVNSHGDKSVLPSPPAIIDIPVDTIHPRPDLPSGLGPPPPNVLAHLLSTISPRKELYSPVLDDPDLLQSPSAYSTDPSPEQTTADSELVTPPPTGYLDGSIVSPNVVNINGIRLSNCRPHPLGEAEDRALTDSIKGLYHLWKAGRKEETDERDRSVFLRIVQSAITCD